MFRKVLVANRGEIAVRVVRGLRELGIASVVTYSDADRGSLTVRLADEAAHIGPSPSSESYLRIDRILDAAKRHGAEAIHQGAPTGPSHGCVHVAPGDAERLFDWAGAADVMVIVLKTTP